jgi:hypothetical protein
MIAGVLALVLAAAFTGAAVYTGWLALSSSLQTGLTPCSASCLRTRS